MDSVRVKPTFSHSTAVSVNPTISTFTPDKAAHVSYILIICSLFITQLTGDVNYPLLNKSVSCELGTYFTVYKNF